MRFRQTLPIVMLAAAACRRGAAVDSHPVAKTVNEARESEGALVSARRLALAPTTQDAPIDRRIAALSSAASRFPRKLEAWIELGRAWLAKAREAVDPGYYLNANACVDVALDISPDDPLALDLRGLVLLNDHKFREARDLARDLLTKNPESPMAWGSLSDALLELGEIEQAEQAAQRMMEIKPNLPSYSRVSYFQWLAGDTKGSLESARLALDAGRDARNLEPRAWVLVQTAMIFWHEGDYDGADAGFLEALASVAEYPPAWVGRGRVAMAKGESGRAAELFERAYRQSPLAETAWLLAEAREQAGDARGAEEAARWAEKEGRADRRTLSLMYSTRNLRAEEALRLARQEREVRADLYTEDALAFALYRNGNIEEASRIATRWEALGTRDARLLYHRGAIAIAAGRISSGKRLLAEALERNPKFDARGAAYAKTLLEAK